MKAILLIFLFGTMGWLPLSAQAQDPQSQYVEDTDPLWEAGLFGFAVYSPHYPASDEYAPNYLGAPYFIYRGDILRIGERGVRGVFYEDNLLEVDISGAAAFNADSEDDKARKGMPDLDYLFELGPAAVVNMGRWYGGKLRLALPVRAVLSTDLGDLQHQGYVFHPELFYGPTEVTDWFSFRMSLCAYFNTRKTNAYFYQVPTQFATDDRTAYQAKAGYLGLRLRARFAFDLAYGITLFTGGQLNYYGGSANEDSPLFRTRLSGAGTIGIRWTIFQSETRIPSRN